jgi:eukaryotic-like serine/threonine-protein kinase
MSDNSQSNVDPFGQIADEFVQAYRQGKRPSVEEFALRYPAHADEIRDLLPALLLMEKARSEDAPGQGTPVVPRLDVTTDHTPVGEPVVPGVDVTTDHAPAGGTPVTPGLDETGDELARGPAGDSGFDEDIAHALPALAEAGYDVLTELGRGGMGVVFKARQRDLNRLVAIKMVLAGEHIPASARARFQTEAQAVAQLHHSGIIQIYDYGQANGMPYFALELAEGGSLKDRLDGSPQLPHDSARTLLQLARGVQAAHDVGIVHRDLKPGNVLLGANGELKIGDFGLAKRLEAEDGHTISGQIVGTPMYMAPEQARGDNTQVGPLADVYALGVILYEMLCGRCPFRGTSPMRTIQLVLDGDLVPPRRLQPGIPRDLETICLKALARETNRRYASAADLADDLERFLQGNPILARRTPVWERAYKWARKRPTTVAWATVSMLALVALLGAGVWYWRQQNLESTAAEKNGQQFTFDGEGKINRGQWNDAKVDFSNARQIVANRPELSELQNRIQANLQRVKEEEERAAQEAKRAREAAAAKSRDETFLKGRNDAIYHAEESADLKPDTGRNTALAKSQATESADLKLAVRKTALAKSHEALALYAVADTGTDKGQGTDIAMNYRIVNPLPESLSDQERATIRSGCYELLVFRAGTLAEKVDKVESVENLRMALAALDSAERLRGRATRAIRVRRSDYLERLGEHVRADREKELSDAQKPEDALDYFLVGVDTKSKENLPKALLDFGETLRRDPNHFWAQYLSAICHLRLGQYEQAIAALYPCIAQRPKLASLYINRGIANAGLAMAAEQKSQTETARTLWDHAADDYNKALQLLETGTLDKEAQALAKYELLINRGFLTLKRATTSSDLQKAAADFQQAKTLRPAPWNSYVNLAHIYRTTQKWDQAIKEIREAIEHNPSVAVLYRERALLQLARAGTPSKKGTLNTAVLDDLASAIKHETNPSLRAGDQVQRARLFYLAGKFDQSVRESDLALALSSDQLDAQLWRTRSLLQLEKYDELLKSVQAYLKSGGKPHVDLYEASGLVQAKHHQYQSAIDSYTLGLRLKDTPTLHTHRGMAYLAERAYGLAFDDFDRAIKGFARDTSNPTQAPTLQASALVGRALARVVLKGEYRQAAEDADRALELDGKDYRTVYKAAVVYALAWEAATAAELRQQERVNTGLSYRQKGLTLLSQAMKRLPPGLSADQFWQDTIINEKALSRLLATSGFRR